MITVRGPGNGLTGYCWQDATVPKPITNPNTPGTTLTQPLRATTLAASERQLNVRVTPDLPGRPGPGHRPDPLQPAGRRRPVGAPCWTSPRRRALPSTYKFGLSASTGGSTDVHLVTAACTCGRSNPLNELQLVKQVDRTGAPLPPVITVGTPIPYQFTVTNAGLETVQNLTIADTKLAGPFTCDRTTLTLAPAVGSTAVCRGSYVVTAADVAAPSIVNIATAHANPVTRRPSTSPPTRPRSRCR